MQTVCSGIQTHTLTVQQHLSREGVEIWLLPQRWV